MKKRILSILLCLIMVVGLLPATAMAAGHFTDVNEKDWFYADVEYAVQLGLVNGTSPTTYSPNRNLTYGSAVKLAACMHKKVTQGNADFTVGTPWYQVYVDYALEKGIISSGQAYDWNANATRAGYIEIFAKAIPDTGLKSGYKALRAINRVDDGAIPDVPASHPQAEAIYKLYRAGILQGTNAETRLCKPDSFIQRSEVATILTRMMNADARVKFEMIGTGGMTVTQQPADVDYLSANGKAVFSTAVTGGQSPYTYKWYTSYDNGATWYLIVNDSTISGVSTKKLTVKLNPADAYSGTLYRCQITDAAGHRIFTRSACVTVENSPLTVTEHPADVTAESGEEVYFNAFAVGGKAPVLYQWQRKAKDGDWQDFPPRNSGYETSRSNSLELVVSDIDFAAGYSYRCKITDAAGTVVYTNAATLKRGTSPLTVAEQPKNETHEAGETATFSVAAAGGMAPYAYQWQMRSADDVDWSNLKDNAVVDGADTSELWIVVEEQDFEYGYEYRCKITDARGSAVYSNAVCAIEALTITRQPEDAKGAVGEQASFVVNVSGGKAPYTYEWQYCWVGGDSWVYVENGELVGGATTQRLDVVITEDVIDSLYQYRCWVYDADNNFLCSDPVIVVEDTTPRIIRQPVSASAYAGEKVKFTMEVSGRTYPFSYQWQYSTDGGSTWKNVTNSANKYSGVQTATLTVTLGRDTVSPKLYRCKFTDSDYPNPHTLYSNSVTATYRRPTVAN